MLQCNHFVTSPDSGQSLHIEGSKGAPGTRAPGLILFGEKNSQTIGLLLNL